MQKQWLQCQSVTLIGSIFNKNIWQFRFIPWLDTIMIIISQNQNSSLHHYLKLVPLTLQTVDWHGMTLFLTIEYEMKMNFLNSESKWSKDSIKQIWKKNQKQKQREKNVITKFIFLVHLFRCSFVATIFVSLHLIVQGLF